MYATRVVRTTPDYLIASRAVGPLLNASAISGEYLSAASFLGVAGMVMYFGYDVLWYPAGYAAGYLFLLLFVAAPLRRFGAYTIPDFAEGRFDSPTFRRVAVVFVLVIGIFYLLPQMKGAGLAVQTMTGAPYWLGVVVVGGIMTLNVALGGMKGITFVQAFQFWVKALAISLPVFVLASLFGSYGEHFQRAASDEPLAFPRSASIEIPPGGRLDLGQPLRFELASGGPVVLADGRAVQPGTSGPVQAPAGTLAAPNGAGLSIPAGETVPRAPTGPGWSAPFGPLAAAQGFPLLFTYSVMIATVFGTAGLPHILVRFYTNRDGQAARQTTLAVLALIGGFYLFPPVFGTIGRVQLPELYSSGRGDALVLELPGLVGGVPGELLRAVTAAGAFAAFMSTSSGLLVAVSGALAHDLYARTLKTGATLLQRQRAFQLAALTSGAVAVLAGLQVERFYINMLVGWAFAIAASSFFPLLVLGIWWKRLTVVGAAAGTCAGGLSAVCAILLTMARGEGFGLFPNTPVDTLLAQPAIWSIPVAFAVMAVVSLLTPNRVPADVNIKMLRMHVPEALGLRTDYIAE
ncbi:MAG: cation acetate symporter [Chloroflexi bacterium]|nr:cation acetate symporter [Chloroflexota bacterium]